ncbi:EAL domain-containing protein [Halodurantibacterium flavum]|uniref:EAL domain-containing protein n=1 Tax=Halodurantibacterium flavum TaxID=1382802 RepID=A0ABW4SAR1_9RHOB
MGHTCEGCRNGKVLDLDISMAFQPILSLGSGNIFAYEALVRGPMGESAASVLAQVTNTNRYAFDQACRIRALETAVDLGLRDETACLSINFMPNAVYEPRACIEATLRTARRLGFPVERIIFEFTESERVEPAHLGRILREYRNIGFRTAVDDFGAGYAGLTLLTQFRPDIVKLDMELVRGVDADRDKRTILGHVVRMLQELGTEIVCEGVETQGELSVLLDHGVDLVQGYLIARPALGALPSPSRVA